jgi:hypothetical protein
MNQNSVAELFKRYLFYDFNTAINFIDFDNHPLYIGFNKQYEEQVNKARAICDIHFYSRLHTYSFIYLAILEDLYLL